MGFRINNNIVALTANANLGKSQNLMSQSIERLSSGLRINRGADDAAGLTISEKLRGQIRGLNRAITNAQDGVSLIQTAEGALNEDAAILNRMRELAIQSQEDALTTNDRLEIQKEVDQLVDEVDRIAKTTEFNTKKLLDGSASALVSSNSNGLEIYQTGNAGQQSTGDYKVRLSLKESGTRQVQMSSILKDKETGRLAGLSSRIGELESFYDNDGNSVVEVPQTITVRGNGKKTEITVSSDMTLEEMAAKIESAVTTSGENGGLGLTGSTFAFNGQTGQIVFESGKEGTSGEIALAADEDVIKALGFQITTESSAASYGVTSTQIGVPNPETRIGSTTTDRATGVIEGLDFKFELSSAARIDGTVAGQDSIKLGNTSIIFTIADTNSGTQQVNGSASSNVTISLTAGRTFTLTSVTNIINNAISNAATSPGIRASFDGYDLKLTSTATGSSATVSILANQPATDILGLNTGTSSGSSGIAARLEGTTDVSSGITIGNQDLQIIMSDGDGNRVPTTAPIIFACGSQVSSVSLTATFNNFFTANSIKVQSQINSSGSLEFVSTETGTDSRISIAVLQGSMAPLGFISGPSAVGSGGNAAVLIGKTHESAKDIGWTFRGPLQISIQDASGASSGAISISANARGGTMGASNSFTISRTSLIAVFDNSSLRTTDVTYEFDAGNRLDFRSRSAGKDSRIIMSTAAFAAGGPTASNMVTQGLTGMGINFRQAIQGSGETEFVVHVSDRALNFQIGANQSQALKFEIVNTSADALGLTGLDITNVKSASRALGAIDRAVNVISSERSKLGSLQNRLNNTINNLTVTNTNLQATESKIRDVDVARETVEFTRNQILIQAGTSQLAQAKAMPQQALQLLQG